MFNPLTIGGLVSIRRSGVGPAIADGIALTGSNELTFVPGDIFSFRPHCSYVKDETLAFSIENQPAWASFDTVSGRLSGTMTAGYYSGITITVTSSGGSTASFGPFDLYVMTLPTIDNDPDASFTVATSTVAGDLWSYTPTITNPLNYDLTFGVIGLPDWMDGPDAVTGELFNKAGRPTQEEAGFYAVTLTATDTEFTISNAFSIEVIAANTAPVISGTPTTAIEAGADYSFTPTLYDADGDAMTVKIVNKPAGWTFDGGDGVFAAGTGALTKTGVVEGTYANITLSVSDGTDTASLTPFTVVATAVEVYVDPILGDAVSPITFDYNAAKTITLAMFNYTLHSSAGSPVLTVEDSLDGNYIHTGNSVTPIANFEGTLDLRLTLSDNHPGSATFTKQVTVNRDTFLSFSAALTTDLSATVTTVHGQAITVTSYTTNPPPEATERGVVISGAYTNYMRYNEDMVRTGFSWPWVPVSPNNYWTLRELQTDETENYWKVTFHTTADYLKQAMGEASGVPANANTIDYTASFLLRVSASNAAATMTVTMTGPDNVTTDEFVLQKGAWVPYAVTSKGVAGASFGSLTAKLQVAAAGAIDIKRGMCTNTLFRTPFVPTTNVSVAGIAQYLRMEPCDAPLQNVVLMLSVDVVARPPMERCVGWFGSDEDNGYGVFLSNTELLVRKLDAGATIATLTYTLPAPPDSVYNIRARQLSTGMALVINNVTQATQTDAAAQAPLTGGGKLWIGSNGVAGTESNNYVSYVSIMDVSEEQPIELGGFNVTDGVADVSAQTITLNFDANVKGVPLRCVNFEKRVGGAGAWITIMPSLSSTTHPLTMPTQNFFLYTFDAGTFTGSDNIRFSLTNSKLSLEGHYYQCSVSSNEAQYHTPTRAWDTTGGVGHVTGLRAACSGLYKLYNWDDVEPTFNNYTLAIIRADIAHATANNYKLVIGIRERIFSIPSTPIDATNGGITDWDYHFPAYMGTPSYNSSTLDNEYLMWYDAQVTGLDTMIWSTTYKNRLKALWTAIFTDDAYPAGLDGKTTITAQAGFGGVYRTETALGLTAAQKTVSLYTQAKYINNSVEITKHIARYCPRHTVSQFMNFLEANPPTGGDSNSALLTLLKDQYMFGVRPGGPDICQYRNIVTYDYIRSYFSIIPGENSGQNDTYNEPQNGEPEGTLPYIPVRDQRDWAVGAVNQDDMNGDPTQPSCGSDRSPQVAGLGVVRIVWNFHTATANRRWDDLVETTNVQSPTTGGKGGSAPCILRDGRNPLNPLVADCDLIRRASDDLLCNDVSNMTITVQP